MYVFYKSFKLRNDQNRSERVSLVLVVFFNLDCAI